MGDRTTIASTPTALSHLFLFQPRLTNPFVFSSVPKLLQSWQPRQLLGFNCLIILAYFCSKDTSGKDDGPPLKQHYLYNSRSSLICVHCTYCLIFLGSLHILPRMALVGGHLIILSYFFHILKDTSISRMAVTEMLLVTFYLRKTCKT